MPKRFTAPLTHEVEQLTLRSTTGHSAWTPNTDVYETPDQLIVKMELAGIAPADIEIVVHDRLLVVCGCREDACRPRQHRCSFRQMEIDYGYFERRIVLSQTIDASEARACMKNGFLRIELPKAERCRQSALAITIERLG
jgi:HSP20 family protein